MRRTLQRKGDAAPAFAQLYSRYQRKIAAYVSAMVNYNQAVIDDVLQDTFLTAWKKINLLQDETRFFQWLVTIARNTAMDALRDKKRTDEISEIFSVDEDSEQDEPIDMGQTESMLASLDSEERETVVYKAILEYSFEEIAAVLGNSVSAVKMRYYRALEKLKQANGQ